MNPKTQSAVRFLQTWVINTLAVLVTVEILHNHITYGDKIENLLIVSLLLGILNAFVRPILMLIALPLLIFTLGLFTLVINALLLAFLTKLLPFFHITGDGVNFSFGYAFLGALMISLIALALNVLTGNARVKVQKRPQDPPNHSGGGGGNGPVIDV
jgi:putative membrane protein